MNSVTVSAVHRGIVGDPFERPLQENKIKTKIFKSLHLFLFWSILGGVCQKN